MITTEGDEGGSWGNNNPESRETIICRHAQHGDKEFMDPFML